MRTLPDYLRLPLALGYFSGMRLGEVLSLEWNQVDFIAAKDQIREEGVDLMAANRRVAESLSQDLLEDG